METLAFVPSGNIIPPSQLKIEGVDFLLGTRIELMLHINSASRDDHKFSVRLEFANPAVVLPNGDEKGVSVELDQVLDFDHSTWQSLLKRQSVDYASFLAEGSDEHDDENSYDGPMVGLERLLTHLVATYCRVELEWGPHGRYGGSIDVVFTIEEAELTGRIDLHSVQDYLEVS